MKKRGWILLLAAVLLLAVGCGEKGAGKILSTEGVPQEVLQSAQYKAAQAEETATVIAYNYVPLTDSAPVRAAVEKMQAGEDAELRYYNFYDRNDCQGIDGMRLTVKDGVAAFQEASLTGYGDTVDWENVLYQQAGEIRLNSCGELSIIDSVDYIYEVFSPLDTYEDYNKRYELTKPYLYPLAEGCTQNFTSPEGITDPLWWARLCWFLTDGETDYPEGHEVPIDEIEEVLLKVSGENITPNYQIIVGRENNTDTLDINVEMSEKMFSDDIRSVEKLEKEIVSKLRSMLGIGAKVHLVNPKTIARSEGKAQRIIDNRKL